jgi:hypothetical protein
MLHQEIDAGDLEEQEEYKKIMSPDKYYEVPHATATAM